MILINLHIRNIKIKGTIILFLFLLLFTEVNAQKYKLQIFSENTSVHKKIIKNSYKRSYQDTNQVVSELQRIKNKIITAGFIGASIDSILIDSLIVNAYLYTGNRYYVNKIEMIETELPGKQRYDISADKFKKGIFDPDALFRMYEDIISGSENSGYPFAEIIPLDVELKDSTVNLKIKIDKGNLIKFNRIIIKGKSNLSEKYIGRYLSVFKDAPYDEGIVTEIQSKINDLNFIDQIRSPEIDFYDDKADVYLYLNKRKANRFNGVIGFIPDQENEFKLSFTGDVNITLLNNFKGGEKIDLHWVGLGDKSQKLMTGINYPFMFSGPFGSSFNFHIDKKDTTYIKINTKLGLDYAFKNNDKIYSFAEWKNSFIISNSEVDTSIYANSKSFIFALGYFTENLDYKFNPSRGIVLSTDIGAGTGTAYDSKNTYYAVNALFESYIPIFKTIVLKIASENRYLLSKSKLYENELFKLGGFKSIRGFDEDIFISDAYSVLRSELRFLFERNSNVYLFADYARLNVYEQNVKSLKFPLGFGVGTNFSTKAGIFSLSYALGKLNDQAVQLSNSKIHVGYVNRF